MTFPKPCDACKRVRDIAFVPTGTTGRGRKMSFQTGEWLCNTCGPRRFPGYPWEAARAD